MIIDYNKVNIKFLPVAKIKIQNDIYEGAAGAKLWSYPALMTKHIVSKHHNQWSFYRI